MVSSILVFILDRSWTDRMRSIAISVSVSLFVCLSVCLSVCPLAFLKTHMSKFREIFCTCYLQPWLDPCLTAMQYLILPLLWMTSCQSEWARVKNDASFLSSSPDSGSSRTSDNAGWSSLPSGGTGAKSAVFDCILLPQDTLGS